VGPRAGLDTEARGKILLPLPGIEPRSPGRPVRTQTLLIELPGSQHQLKHTIITEQPLRSDRSGTHSAF
jgi:hypothetical protein